MNIILCGLPGSGKSSVGKILSDKFGRELIETDRLIEEEYHKTTGKELTCRQIFQKIGEGDFRDLEHTIIAKLMQAPPKNSIISLGGGTLLSLNKIGLVVYLQVDAEDAFERINRSGLPSYLDPNAPFNSFNQLVKKRIPFYETSADILINTTGKSVQEIAMVILEYPILVKDGLLHSQQLLDILASSKASLYVVITDTNTERFYGNALVDFLKESGFSVSQFSFPAGEDSKSRQTKEACEDHLFKLGAGRDTCIIGLGGGVVTDLAGFTASTYCRGVSVVLLPTSLLGMVDASIGGKTGVNLPYGKNMIGTIYQPNAILVDTSTLKTLPLDEIKNGVSEMIKHGLIADLDYFNFLKNNAQKILNLDMPIMENAITESIRIKSEIVQEDETEQGKRRLLNLGHTVAHVIETATEHTISHGRAVAIGVITECYLSMQMGHLSKTDFEQIYALFKAYKINLECDRPVSVDELYSLMRMDKKSVNQNPRFVLLERIGKPLEFENQFCSEVDEDLLKNSLEWMCSHVMRRY